MDQRGLKLVKRGIKRFKELCSLGKGPKGVKKGLNGSKKV